MGRYEALSTAIIVGIPIVVGAVLVGLVMWARDAVARDASTARVGLFVTAVAITHLFVPRDLSGEVNRPLNALLFSEGHAQRAGLAGVQVVVLCVLATSLAVRRRQALASAR